jgi:hypothetical protein
MNFEVLESNYAIYRFGKGSSLPDWIFSSGFYSITKTKRSCWGVQALIENDHIFTMGKIKASE